MRNDAFERCTEETKVSGLCTFKNSKLSAHQSAQLLTMITSKTELNYCTRLCLRRCALSEAALCSLANSVLCLPALRTLDVSGNLLLRLDSVLNAFSDMLEQCEQRSATPPLLTCLNVSHGNVCGGRDERGSESLRRFCNVACRVLRVLFMQSQVFLDNGAILMAEALEQPECRVRVLNLASAQFYDRGGERLARALRVNQSLRAFSVRSNMLSMSGALAFADALRHDNTTLRHIDLNFVQARGIEHANAFGEVADLNGALHQVKLCSCGWAAKEPLLAKLERNRHNTLRSQSLQFLCYRAAAHNSLDIEATLPRIVKENNEIASRLIEQYQNDECLQWDHVHTLIFES
jgi:hypothetical protein